MKFMQIYSDNDKFKSFRFVEGLNVILGKITHEENRKIDTHNLGKSTLINVLDFMLLKNINKKHMFKKHIDKFKNFTFFLEIKLNNEKYITIKRSVKNNTKISFKLHNNKYQNYINETNWDYKELSINSKHPEKNPINILNNYLSFDVLENYNYRKTLNYFLRTQDDYKDIFHLNKFKGSDIEWKPFLFQLLGFSGKYLYDKYELEDKKNSKKQVIKDIKEKFSIDYEEVDKINGTIGIKQLEKQRLQELIDNFDFYLKERNINKSLIDSIENKVSELNTLEYNLEYEIRNIQESIRLKLNYNVEDIKKVYNEAKIYFPTQITKDYDSLIEFNNRVTEERNKYLKEIFINKKKLLEETRQQLKKLNIKRSNMLSFVKEKDSFKKFKKYQMDIINIDREIATLQSHLENIDIIKQLNADLDDTVIDINKVSSSIQDQITLGNDLYTNIRTTFYNLTKEILNKSGRISIYPNKKGNVEFNADILDDEDNELTSQGDGNSYKKILCACFDLSLLICYCNKSFYRFVYHDGIFESLDNRKKMNYIDVLNKVCDHYGIQIIITLIEDDLPYLEDKTKYTFPDEQIVLELNDNPDNSGKLFSMEF
ncbi:DUF2326 domain-containing protein [Clostridium tyrobutyricum]|uniref:DUF2326 domain-containing protein n=1 Tax=Clostridium tyrobutyricum TaxID=1519 RepID=UPI001C3866A1|nr:DUF2326 domain-containing protein [Clostridium tyrobutyricum]MBV4422784.1 DUF2326 domain-containing protein [Clostridium tyrobutyricum]